MTFCHGSLVSVRLCLSFATEGLGFTEALRLDFDEAQQTRAN